MGRQHQGVDRPGVRQVPEGSEEQGNMEKTGCKIICGAPTTLAVKGLMMMMMTNAFVVVVVVVLFVNALSLVFPALVSALWDLCWLPLVAGSGSE